MTTGALGYGAFTVSGDDWLLLASLVVILSLVRIAYSARDHILLGLFQRHSRPAPVGAVHARGACPTGGDPELIDLEADYAGRRAGAAGGRALAHTWGSCSCFLRTSTSYRLPSAWT